LYIKYYLKKHVVTFFTCANVWTALTPFKQCMWGCLATKCHLLEWCVVDRKVLNMVVHAHVPKVLLVWHQIPFYFSFFSSLSLSYSNFVSTPVKFQNNSYNFFFPLHLVFMLLNTIFLISYKIINDFQFHPILFLIYK